MDDTGHSYVQSTRHPWASFWFLLPLLGVYEAGVLYLGGTRPEALRNGADAWLRWGLLSLGLQQLYLVPIAVLAILLIWSVLRRADRPQDLLGTCTGMAIESVAFALLLWGLSRGLGPFMDRLGIVLNQPAPGEESLGQLITFMGAGIYEEVLFRLLLFSGLVCLCQLCEVPDLWSVLIGAIIAAVLFAAAHHLGGHGERWNGYVFVFRTLAGLYFTLLFCTRGFGIAVGAHACYDVLVGTGFG